MILVITNEKDVSVNPVIDHIQLFGANVFRLNTEMINTKFWLEFEANNLHGGLKIIDLESEKELLVSDVLSVYYRRPESPTLGDTNTDKFTENEIGFLGRWMWDLLEDAFWVSKYLNIRRAGSKLLQLRLAPQMGFLIPDTIISSDHSRILRFYEQHEGRVITKPLATGAIQHEDGVYGIFASRVSSSDLIDSQVFKVCPTVFQERVEKRLEVRVTVVGNQAFPVEIHSQCSERTKDDWRRYDLDNTPHAIHVLPADLELACVNLVARLGLRYGAIDLILNEKGEYVFLEINPNGQWLWLEALTGAPISKAIAKLLVTRS